MAGTSYIVSQQTRTIGTATEQPQHLKIVFETGPDDREPGVIEALFNPNRLDYAASAAWTTEETLNGAASVSFSGSQPMTLSLDLLFDTSERDPTSEHYNVLAHTTRMLELLRPHAALGRPPRCELLWGRYLLIRGVLESVRQEFTRFAPDGTPVRARLACSFREAETATVGSATGRREREVRYRTIRGDRPDTLALRFYNDRGRWRDIVAANPGLRDNLEDIPPGTLLKIP
jgi:phage tail protein X